MPLSSKETRFSPTAIWDLAVVAEETLEFRDRLGRDDEIALVALRKLQVAVDHGEAAAVGGHQRQLVVLEGERECR